MKYIFAALIWMNSSIGLAEDFTGYLVDGPSIPRNEESQVAKSQYQGFASMHNVSVDADTGAISKVVFSVDALPSVSEDAIDAEARRILDTYSDDLALDGDRLEVLEPVDLTESAKVVAFERYREGRRIEGALIQLVFARQGKGFWKPSKLRSRSYASQLDGAYSGWSGDELRALFNDVEFVIGGHESIFWPRRSTAGRLLLEPITKFQVTDSQGETFAVYANDRTRKVEQVYSLRVSADVVVKGEVYERSYLDQQRVGFPIKATTMEFGDSQVVTRRDGTADIVSASADVSLTSPIVRVRNGNSNQSYTINGTDVDENGSINVDGTDLVALNSYIAIQRIDEFVRGYLAPSETAILRNQMDVRVNFSSAQFRNCNAFYQGGIGAVGRISLLVSGGGCANMGLVNDVTFHEWGHGLDNYTGQPRGITDGAFSEGIGDILAAYYVGSPNMGEGFFQGQVQGIRAMNNNQRFPEDRGEVHVEGRIIGGAFWDMRVGLIASHGEARGAEIANFLFLRHLLVASSYRDSYDILLDIDDDDGNPATRSPNHCVINSAFARHGLATDEGCSDDIAAMLPLVDVEAAIVDMNGSQHLAVSLVDGDDVYACVNSEDQTCSNRITFTYNGYVNGRYVFVSKSALPTSPVTSINIFSMEKDKVLGRRPFKLYQR